MSKAKLTSAEKAAKLVQYADDMKADRIEQIDVRSKTPVTDWFVVCSGTSDVHVNAILEKVREKLAEDGVKPLRSDTQGAGWVLMDYGDVVFHVMREEKRQFYDLETLWTNKEPNPDLLP